MFEKVPVTWRDIIYLDPGMHIMGIQPRGELPGYSMFRYGQLIAAWAIVEFEKKSVAVFSALPKARKYPILMVKEGRKLLDGRSDIFAYADTAIPRSDAYLQHLGFSETGEVFSGMKEYKR